MNIHKKYIQKLYEEMKIMIKNKVKIKKINLDLYNENIQK